MRHNPLRCRPHQRGDWRGSGGRRIGEMGVENGAKPRRHRQARHQFTRHKFFGNPGRHGKDHGAVTDINRPFAEIQRCDAAIGANYPPKPARKLRLASLCAQGGQCRVNKHRVQRRHRHQRPAGAPPTHKTLGQKAPRQPRRPLFRRAIEHRQHHRFHHAPPERACAVGDDISDGLRPPPREQQPRQGPIIRQPCARRALGHIEYPQGQAPIIHRQGPPLARTQIVEGEVGVGWPLQHGVSAQPPGVIRHRLIARENEMVAVVDHLPQLRIEVRAAAAPGARGGIDQLHRDPGLGQGERGVQPGKACADYDGPCEIHQPVIHSRRAMSASRHFDTPTRARGAVQPAAHIRASTRA